MAEASFLNGTFLGLSFSAETTLLFPDFLRLAKHLLLTKSTDKVVREMSITAWKLPRRRCQNLLLWLGYCCLVLPEWGSS
ncbi:MAG: hypothetical protein MUE44_17135 [Oscillatoriaceae cyanobacterium Prado104]|nr:hypothetical protein [Oscillatoriaceae cyanobacterium Prado104]